MGRIYKRKKRSCPLCKPHKTGGAPRNKARYIEPEDDIEERLADLHYIDGIGNILPHRPRKPWYHGRHYTPPPPPDPRKVAEQQASLSNKSDVWFEDQLKFIEEYLAKEDSEAA